MILVAYLKLLVLSMVMATAISGRTLLCDWHTRPYPWLLPYILDIVPKLYQFFFTAQSSGWEISSP
jgi:hypothetical protein